jgi:hypothetical protein
MGDSDTDEVAERIRGLLDFGRRMFHMQAEDDAARRTS